MSRPLCLAVVAVGLLVTVLAIVPARRTNSAATDGVARARISGADASGFTVELDLPVPGHHVSYSGGAPCAVPRLAALPGGPAPAPGEATYGWLVGLAGPLDAVVRAEEVIAAPWVPGRRLCPAGVMVPAKRWQVGRSLADALADGAASGPPFGEVPMTAAAVPTRHMPVAALEPVGDLRGQSVARLVVRPLARNADGGLVFRSHIRLRVDYRHPESIELAPPQPGPFGAVLGTLLNHPFLPRRVRHDWSRPPATVARGPAQTGPPWTAPADPRGLKIVVDRDGPQAVTGADLAGAGWDLASVNPANLALMVGGRAVAYSLSGVVGGRLTPASRLVFQGRAMTGQYTRANVYWLLPDGARLDLAERAAGPGIGTPAQAFSETLRFEQDTRWFASMNPRDGDDRWMWGEPLNAADPARRALTVTLPVANLAPLPAAGRLRIQVQGYTADARVSPDHHLRVLLNDQPLGSWHFDGTGVHVGSWTVPAGTLAVGDNRLALQAVGDTGALVDQVYLNHVALELAAGYRASGDRLDFAAPGPGAQELALAGFTGAEVTVLDVTDPTRPVRLIGAAVEAADDGTYTVRLRDDWVAGRRYVAFGPAAVRPPARIVPNMGSDWRSGAHGADYIVITHPDFAAALQPLLERRRAQGLRVVVVLIDDVYHEFSHGVFDPRAIRAFLRHAYREWVAPAPTYVLLVGEANLDYRRGYNSGPPNFVPSVTLDEQSGSGELTAFMSDQWFAMMGDDPVPDLLLGRFSVSTPDQADTVVAKTLRYADQPQDAPWRRRAVLVTDDTDGALMEQLSEELASRLPADTDLRRFYAAHYPVTRPLTADLVTTLDEGALLLNFTGHANVALWSPWPGGGYIFDNAGIGRLRNGDAMPIFTAASCMNGWVDHPLKPVSMAELWLTHPHGGGAVAWAPSGFSTLSAQRALFPSLYDGLYDGLARPVGALVGAAAATALGQGAGFGDAVNMYVLLGDPALVVSGVPPRPTPSATPMPRPPAPGLFLPYARRRER